MTLLHLLENLHYEGQISLRRKTKRWFEYLSASQSHMIRCYETCEVVHSCIIDSTLVLYVE